MPRSRYSASLTLLVLPVIGATVHAQATNTFPSSGNVGIGTTNPTYRLMVQGNHYDAQTVILSDHLSQGMAGANSAILNLWASEPGYTWHGVGIGNNMTNGLERMVTVRGSSYVRFLDNQIIFGNIDTAGTKRETVGVNNGTLWATGGANFYKPGGGNVSISTEGGNSYNVINSLNNAGGDFLGLVVRTPLLTATGAADFSGYVRSVNGSTDVRIQAGPNDTGVGAYSNHPLLLITSGQERMRFTTTGLAAIGTTVPSAKLTVTGAAGDGRNVSLDSREIKFRGDGIAHFSIYGATDGKPYLSIGETSTSYLPGALSSETLVVASGGKVGIGNTSPGYRLDIGGSGTGATAPALAFNEWNVRQWIVGAGVSQSGKLSVVNSSTGTAALTIDGSNNVGIGTANPTNKLEVNGTIRTKEVIVETTGWADHVLAKGYPLAPLSEVEAHIAAKGTLPGIPSAAEVAEHGASIGDMQVKLLAKLEELTLHLIVQEKRIDALEAENATLRAKP